MPVCMLEIGVRGAATFACCLTRRFWASSGGAGRDFPFLFMTTIFSFASDQSHMQLAPCLPQRVDDFWGWQADRFGELSPKIVPKLLVHVQ